MEKNIKTLRDDLLDAFDALRQGTLANKAAKEITNMAGKIILSARVELDYNKFLDNKKVIAFLNVDGSDITSTEKNDAIAALKQLGLTPDVKVIDDMITENPSITTEEIIQNILKK